MSFAFSQGVSWTGVAMAVALAACSSSSSGGGHVPLPQVTSQGGSVLTSPNVVTITFAGDPMASQLEAFGQTLTSSAWWDAVRSGVCANGSCVGDGPPGVAVEIPTPAAASYTDSSTGGASTLQTWLTAAIANGTLPAPGAGSLSNTIYIVYLPETTSVSLDGETSCVAGQFIGYHSWWALGTQQVPYAVIVECAPSPPPTATVAPTSLLEQTTIAASHETVEAATDPIPDTGFVLDPTNTSNWGWMDVTGGGELADMCVDLLGFNQDHTSDGTFIAQRIWSNARAAALEDPCTPPLAGAVYFNVAPEKSFFVLGVGESTTFDANAFSFSSISDWTVLAADFSASATDTYLAFLIDGGTDTQAGPTMQVNNGSTVQITMTLTRDPGSLVTGEADGALVSFAGNARSPTSAHVWSFAVMSPADAQNAGIPGSSTDRAPRRPGGSATMKRGGSRTSTLTVAAIAALERIP